MANDLDGLFETPPNPTEQEKSKPTDIASESQLTPISKQEIPSVDANSWANMTVSELYDQVFILEQRILYCQQYGKHEAAKQIRQGIDQLRALINSKSGDQLLI